jgi:uncharacterized protein YdaU (DUF1376 family)
MMIHAENMTRAIRRLGAMAGGALFLLIQEHWERGPLPDDPAELARLAKVTPTGWASMSDAVLAHFTRTDRGLVLTNSEPLVATAEEVGL